MTSEPLVSIILPTYNRARWIGDAVESIQCQTWTRWELLIIDDGSTDDTWARVPNDPRIRFVRRPHTGNVGAVRQAGLLLASGAYVAFQDSDDRWLSERLTAQVRRLERSPASGWCHGDFAMIDEAGAEVARRAGPPWRVREGNVLREVLTGEASIALQTVVARRDLAVALGFNDWMRFGDDYDFLIRLAAAAPAAAVNTIVAHIREHPGRGTHGRYDQSLYMAMAYRQCQRRLSDRSLRQICRTRAVSLLRHYLANARARGELWEGVCQAAAAWAARLR
jgi:glycosyltransferase involved in cell wall biosynthesis